MKVLVTGGQGFIGRYTVEHLFTSGHMPVTFDRHDTGDNIGQFILGDTRDDVAVFEAVARVDGVIHLAGVLGTQETIKNPRPAFDVNINGGINILEACAHYDVPLVNIAVGNFWMNNSYAISKNTVERLVQMYVTERDARACTVRAVNAYGPRQVAAPPYGPSKVRKVMPALICRALAGHPIEIYGDGQQVMDMVHVRDVARVLVAALDSPAGVTYDAGPGRRTTVLDIAKQVVVEVGGGDIVHLPMRPGEHAHAEVIADPTTLYPLGIDPASLVDLEAGVKETVEWFRSER
jgi:UDP-glucose 4-epimerase